MSLHLGNLSSRVRIDELERVFRRFGWCNVRVKDRFGFVVYDVPGNAEEALRTLKGKRICGESISLSWSNRQPRPMQRSTQGGRSYESHHRRDSARENHVDKKLGLDGRREIRVESKLADVEATRFSSDNILDEKTKYGEDIGNNYAPEKHQNDKEDLIGGGGRTESILLDKDRWEEQVCNLSKDRDMENRLEFERYEPYEADGDENRGTDEKNHAISQGASTAVEDWQNKTRVVKSSDRALNLPVNMKSKKTCYTCGDSGHKMHNCPRGKDDKRKTSRSLGIFGRLGTDHRQDDKMNSSGKGEYKLKQGGSMAQGSQQLGRDDATVRPLTRDRDSSRSRKLRHTESGKSPAENETNRTRTNRHWQKKRRRENGSPERQHTKKSSSVLTPVHSDYAASKSKIKRSTSRSNSRTRLRSHSLSSLSSSSTSHHTKPEKCRFRSRLRSRSKSNSRSTASLSLSASASQSLLSSPSKGQIPGNLSLKTASLEAKEFSFGQEEGVKTYVAESGNSKLQSVMIAAESGSATPFKLDGDVDKNHFQKRNDNNFVMSKDSSEETNVSASQLKEADPTGWHLSPNSLQETKDDLCIPEHVPFITNNHESEAVLRSHIINSKCITSEEMHMALKHYGLQHPEEIEKDLPLETYFGSARFWPWEIIYYRRLRKGPISIENYARRVAQNEEFGITDKFVRSSSGWSECENMLFEKIID